MTVFSKHKKKIDWKFHYMHETVPPSATHRVRHAQRMKECSAVDIGKKHSNDLPFGVEIFFVRGGNWKFWSLITCWGTFFAVGCTASVMGWMARQWRMPVPLLGLPKSQLAYIANNRRYVNFGAFFSRGMFDSRFFCHDSINSAFIPRQFTADNWPKVACVGTAGWGLGVVPIVAFLSLSVSLSTFKLRQSYEPWIIPSGPENHQIWA